MEYNPESGMTPSHRTTSVMTMQRGVSGEFIQQMVREQQTAIFQEMGCDLSLHHNQHSIEKRIINLNVKPQTVNHKNRKKISVSFALVKIS